MAETSRKHPPFRAFILSMGALIIPVAGALWLPRMLEDYQALLWLTALVPVFLLAYYRGWQGAATAAAGGMALISLTYAVTESAGRPVPELLPAVVFFFIAIALAAGGLAERVRRESGTGTLVGDGYTDPESGLPNRSHAELHLDIEFSTAQRGRPLAVIIFDLDNFKGYNARHGAIAGDEILRILGEVMKRTTRRMNLAARYGDDEFVAVLGGCDDDGAMVFVGRFQEALRSLAAGRPLPSISGGVASYNPSMSTYGDLLAAAEQALKQAKKEGRGRIRVHGRSIAMALTHHGEATDEAPAEGAPQPVMPQGRGQGRKALIVAEDAPVRALLARFMADHGFTVAQVSNIVDGVQCLTIEYDLLFSDISLTEGFGSELVRAAKLRWPSIQVLGILHEHEGDLLIDTLNAGVDRYLVTPLDLPKVRQHITDLLARRDRLATSVLESRQLTLEFKARSDDAVDALRHTEEELRDLVSTLHEVVFRADVEGTFTSLSAPWTSAAGHAVEDTVGRPMTEFIHDEDRAEFAASLRALVAGELMEKRQELRLVTKNGAARWFDVRMRRVFDADSRLIGVAGTLDDVTARKSAEAALRRSEETSRALLAALPDDVYYVSREGVILAYEGERTDAARLNFAGGSLEQAFPSAVAAALRERLEKVLNSGAVDIYEYRTMTDNSLNEFEVRLAPAGPGEAVAIVRNVTDSKLLEEQLRQSQKLEAIGRLAGGLAHDFNNLLTVVQGNAQLLGEEPLPDSAREYVSQIDDASTRGAALVKQLLAFGRRQVMQPTILNLNTVIGGTRIMLERLLGENVMLDVDLDPAAGLVRADPGQIEQILVNLGVNARDAMKSGGHLRITTRNAVMATPLEGAGDGDDRFVVLTVSDDGAGMDAETRSRVFEPFFTTKGFAQASGLGLATVYGIVRQSGGNITVSSEPGRGTTFEIAFPRVDV